MDELEDASLDLFTAFFKPLQQATLASKDEIDYLDEEHGIALQYAGTIEQLLEQLQDGDSTSAEDRASLTQEANTWQLLQALYLHRAHFEPSSTVSTSSNTSQFKYTPPLTIVQEAISKHGLLSELSIVRDWLHDVAYPKLQPAEVRHGYLPYTKNKLKQALRTNPESLADDKLVRALDPDASNRSTAQGKRRAIDSEDANYERALVRTLYEYVRVGELDQAMDMARQSDCSWRAASLAGGKLFQDALLSRSARSQAAGSASTASDTGAFEEDLDREQDFIQGNLRRKLWKKSCRIIASSQHLDVYERALYGAVAGDEASVLAVAETWEDHVWARINALMEDQIDALLLKAEDNYFVSHDQRTDQEDDSNRKAKTKPDGIMQTLQSIFNNLLAEPSLHVEARSPFHVAQSWVILNRVNDLLQSFAGKLEDSSAQLEEPQLAQLLRFFSHFILFHRLISRDSAQAFTDLPSEASSAIIEAYVRALIFHGKTASLIAFYCTALDMDHATEVYSQYLFEEYAAADEEGTLDDTTDRYNRLAAIDSARTSGLDATSIAKRVTELTVQDISMDLPDFNAAKASFGLDALLTANQANEQEAELIRSVQWLAFDKSTHPEALIHANALIRYFLCAGSPSLACRVTEQIPPELLRSASAEHNRARLSSNQIHEYDYHQAFFQALQLHMHFTDAWSRRPSSGQRSEELRYGQELEKITDQLWKAFIGLFQSNWLVDEVDEDGTDVPTPENEQRLQELRRIRCAYLPELVFRLHTALVSSGELYVPANIRKALELPGIVADERFRIYLEFLDNQSEAGIGENRMPTYLGMVREANLLKLKQETPSSQRA